MLKRRTKWLYIAVLAVEIVGSLCLAGPRHAAAEPGEPGPYGTRLNFGYFFGRQENYGPAVIPGGVPARSIPELVDEITSRARNVGGGWSMNDIRGAQFIIQTMRQGAPGLPSDADINDWIKRIYSLVNNEGGHINFDDPVSFNVNSYYQPGNQDDAFYDINHGAYVWLPWAIDPDGELTGNSIAFYDKNGTRLYAIRRACGNPVGWPQVPGLPQADPYNLVPVINATVNSGAPGATAEPGDTIQFDYRVNNTSGTPSDPTNCSIHNTNHAGYFATPGSPEGGGSAIASSCPKTFDGNSSTQIAGVETVVAPANTTVCRTLFINPATPSGNTVGTEVCIPVASKPYVKVFGGDVSVGGGVESAPDTCTSNPNASIISWNEQRTAGSPGAGTQFAAFALSAITDFATAQVNSGSATPATALSFANTSTDAWNNNFGGHFGSAPCIKDYYGQKPASTQPLSALAHGNGVYSASGNQTFTGGTLNPGDKWVVYVDGNVYISNSLQYSGPWNASNVPLLQVVVRGNIYIDGNVSQLDGVYIAQKDSSGNGGKIYTCGTASGPWSTTDVNYFNACNHRLTVNGAFIADSISLLRTTGTVNQSTVSETSGTSKAAEVFNYGPAAWLTQPPQNVGNTDDYDAITSLPPVL